MHLSRMHLSHACMHLAHTHTPAQGPRTNAYGPVHAESPAAGPWRTHCELMMQTPSVVATAREHCRPLVVTSVAHVALAAPALQVAAVAAAVVAEAEHCLLDQLLSNA